MALDGSDPTSAVPEFPLRLSGAASAVLPDGPVVCGGYITDTRQHSDRCFQLVESEWTELLPAMPRARSYCTMHVMGDGRLWVLGGASANGIERAVDVYDPAEGEWEEAVVDMPAGGVAEHCSVKLDEDRVMIVGGRQWEVDQSTNYRQSRIFNTFSLTFGEPVYLNVQRGNPACGLFDLEDGGQVVVAAGGKTPRLEKSDVRFVELFDLKVSAYRIVTAIVAAVALAAKAAAAAVEIKRSRTTAAAASSSSKSNSNNNNNKSSSNNKSNNNKIINNSSSSSSKSNNNKEIERRKEEENRNNNSSQEQQQQQH